MAAPMLTQRKRKNLRIIATAKKNRQRSDRARHATLCARTSAIRRMGTYRNLEKAMPVAISRRRTTISPNSGTPVPKQSLKNSCVHTAMRMGGIPANGWGGAALPLMRQESQQWGGGWGEGVIRTPVRRTMLNH